MFILVRSIKEIIKIFLISLACSVVFAIMIYRDNAISSTFVCTILNTASMLLFLYLTYASWSNLYDKSYSQSEYFVPTISAFIVYAIVSSVLYITKFFSVENGSIFYMFLFLPTRFLEPKLKPDFAFVSVLLTHIALFSLIFITPSFVYRNR